MYARAMAASEMPIVARLSLRRLNGVGTLGSLIDAAACFPIRQEVHDDCLARNR
jgi:hypothetical protein